MCGIHAAGAEILSAPVSVVTPTIVAVGVVAFLTVSLMFMWSDGRGGGF